MKVIHLGNRPVSFEEPLSLAVGYFDGLHKGHLQLIDEVKKQARDKGLKTAVLSFDPNPLVTLGIILEERLITSLKDREEILEELGIDYFLILDFNKEIANLSSEEFVSRFIIDLNVKQVVCGFDFYFGKQGSGDSQTLKALAQGNYEVSVIEKITDHQVKISSSRIIESIKEGSVDKARQLLSRPFTIRGKVVHGKKRGRLMGFPTANIVYDGYVHPRFGVYGVVCTIDNQQYGGMCNFGLNPTFTDIDHPSMEVYIFDFNEDIYDQEIKVAFYFYERGEMQFHDMNELKSQLNSDEEHIKKKLKSVI